MAPVSDDIVVPVEPVFYEAPPMAAEDHFGGETQVAAPIVTTANVPTVPAPVVTTPNVPTVEPEPEGALLDILPPVEEQPPSAPATTPVAPAPPREWRWTTWRVIAAIVAAILAGVVIGRVTSSSPNKKSSAPATAADQSAASKNGAQPAAGQAPAPASGSAAPSSTPNINGRTVFLNIPRQTGPLITDHFTVTGGHWTLGWAYDCTGAPGGTGAFNVKVFDGSGQPSSDGGVDQNGAKGSSVVAYTSTGERYLWVTTNCIWAIRVTS